MIHSAALTAAVTFGLVLATSVLQNPIVVGLVVGAPTIYFGWRGLQRTRKLDEIAAQAAHADSQGAATKLVIDGYKQMAEALQTDNRVLRENIAALTTRYDTDKAALSEQYDLLKDECRKLRKRLDVYDGNGE